MPSLSDLSIFLNATSYNQKVVIIFLFMLVISWWIYRKAVQDIERDEQRNKQEIRELLEKLYSPVSGLHESFKGNRIGEEYFFGEFIKIVNAHRYMIKEQDIQDRIGKWLGGDRRVEEELFSHFDKHYNELFRKLYPNCLDKKNIIYRKK